MEKTVSFTVTDYTNDVKHIKELERISDIAIEEAEKYIECTADSVFEQMCIWLYESCVSVLDLVKDDNGCAHYGYTNILKWNKRLIFFSGCWNVEIGKDGFTINDYPEEKELEKLIDNWSSVKCIVNTYIENLVKEETLRSQHKSDKKVNYSRKLENFKI